MSQTKLQEFRNAINKSSRLQTRIMLGDDFFAVAKEAGFEFSKDEHPFNAFYSAIPATHEPSSVPCGNIPDAPNVVIENLQIDAPKQDVLNVFCVTNIPVVFSPGKGTTPFPMMGCDQDMVRMGAAVHYETVTEFDAETLYHKYVVNKMLGSAWVLDLWKGFVAELILEEKEVDGQRMTLVTYYAWIDTDLQWVCDFFTDIVSRIFKSAEKRY